MHDYTCEVTRASIICFEMNSPFDDWRLRMSRAAEDQARLQKEEKQRLAAQAPTAAPAEPGIWNNMTGLQRMVVALRAQERREADERKPRPAPAPEPQSQYIDANYAEALGKQLLGANAQAIAQCQSRKAVPQMKENR